MSRRFATWTRISAARTGSPAGPVYALPDAGVHSSDRGRVQASGMSCTIMDEPAQSVRNPLGSTTITFTPNGSVSARSTRLKPSISANLAAWYEAIPATRRRGRPPMRSV